MSKEVVELTHKIVDAMKGADIDDRFDALIYVLAGGIGATGKTDQARLTMLGALVTDLVEKVAKVSKTMDMIREEENE